MFLWWLSASQTRARIEESAPALADVCNNFAGVFERVLVEDDDDDDDDDDEVSVPP